MADWYDAIIVGGGHNGLVAAAYLAKAGLKCLVAERRHIVGGACVTEEFWSGFKVSSAAYALGLLRPEIIDDLHLKEFGLRFRIKYPQYFVPFPDSKHLFLWGDLDKTVKEIEKFSLNDAKSYVEFRSFWDRYTSLMDAIILTPPPAIEELVEKFTKLAGEDLFRKAVFYSAKALLDEFFESEHLKAALATQSIIGTPAGPMTPGTAFIMGYHFLGRLEGRRGLWAYVEGGMGRVAEALARSAAHYGAVIRTNSEVERILVEDGEAKGVVLRNGDIIRSKVVVSNADPKRTFLTLVGKEHLDRKFAAQVARLRTGGVAMKVHCALDRLPKFTCLPSENVGPQHECTVGVAPSVAYLEEAWNDARFGRPSEKPFIEAFIQSAVDPSLAPPGKHSLSIFAQYAPYRLRDGTWDEIRDGVGTTIVDTLTEYAPNLRGGILYREVLTPLDLERRFYLPEGDIFHLEMTLDQMGSFRPLPGWASYRTPIKNLYLCGSGTHPGGGVTGAPGHNAAHAVISDWRGGIGIRLKAVSYWVKAKIRSASALAASLNGK